MTLSPGQNVQPKRSTRISPGGFSAFCSYLAIGRICDPVRAGTAGRIENRHRARLGIEPPVDAVLPREPDHALAIENRRVQVCVAPLLGKREEFCPVCCGVNSDDCVLPAFCDPSGAVRPNDDTVGRRAGPKPIRSDLPVRGSSYFPAQK